MHWVIDYLLLRLLMSLPIIFLLYFAKQVIVDIHFILIHGVDHEQQAHQF